MRHLNNGTDHRHSKSCCDQSSPARRTFTQTSCILGSSVSLIPGGVLTIFWVTGRLGPFDPPFSTYVEFWPLLLGSDVEYWPPFFKHCRIFTPIFQHVEFWPLYFLELYIFYPPFLQTFHTDVEYYPPRTPGWLAGLTVMIKYEPSTTSVTLVAESVNAHDHGGCVQNLLITMKNTEITVLLSLKKQHTMWVIHRYSIT